MIKKILVTGANGDIGESVGRVLKEEFKNFVIHGTDCNGIYPGKFIFEEIITLPHADDLDYKKNIIKLLEKYDLIIPTSEFEIKAISNFSTEIDISSILILPKIYLDIFFKKYKTISFLKEHNILAPETKYINQIKECDLPIYIKPNQGAGGKGNRLLENKFDLQSAKLLPNKDWVAQEYLNGDENEYTCVIFKFNEKIQTLQLKRKLFGDRTGIAEVVNNNEIKSLLEKLSLIIDFNGSINIQLKLTKNGPMIFEINPRLSSTVMMRNKIGFNDCIWWVKSFFKIPYTITNNIKTGTKVYRMSNEKFCEPN